MFWVKTASTQNATLIKPQRLLQTHVLAASYYSLKDNLNATLMLSNQGPRDFKVQPTLFSMTGQQLALPAVLIKGNTVRAFDLSDWAILGGDSFTEGSVQVVYSGKPMELGGALQMVNADKHLSFDEELTEPQMMFVSTRLEGVWWLPSSACKVQLALSNTTALPLFVNASIDGSDALIEQAVTLMPHESRLFDVADLFKQQHGTIKNYGGISLNHNGAAGALLARGMIADEETGYSAMVEFTDPQTIKSNKIDGAGLRLGQIGNETLSPVVVARNINDSPLTLKGKLSYTLSDGSSDIVPLPETELAPAETKLINLNNALRRLRPRLQSITATGLEFEYEGARGSVIMSAQSVSESGDQVFRTSLVNAESLPSSTGQYPWNIGGNSSTVVYIKNVTDTPQQFNMQINYADGKYAMGLKTLAPNQAISVDIRRLRDQQIPDARGKKIPLTATNGQLHWSVEGDENRTLIGRAEQVNIVQGISMTTSCLECCPDSWNDFWITPGSLTGFAGETAHCNAMQQNVTCYGEVLEPFFVSNPTWSSSNTSVASVDSSGNTQALSVGLANIGAQWTVRFWDYDPLDGCIRYLQTAHPEIACDVVYLRVRVTSPPIPSEDSDTFAGIVAGEPFNILVNPINSRGEIAIIDTTVQVTSSRTIGQTENGLPSTINIRNGTYTNTVMLNRVIGTQRGTTYRFRPNGGGFLDFSFLTWFRVYSTREGLVGGRTGCGHIIRTNDHFVALPVSGLCNQNVILRNPIGGQQEATQKRDAGPHFPGPGSTCDPDGTIGGDFYWNTGTRPRVESLSCETGDNNSGIDLADGTFYSLGSPTQVIWRFD